MRKVFKKDGKTIIEIDNATTPTATPEASRYNNPVSTDPTDLNKAAKNVQKQLEKEIAEVHKASEKTVLTQDESDRKAAKAYTAQLLANYDRKMAVQQAEREELEQQLASVNRQEPDRSPIPSYHLVAQKYYLGYHAAYGVLIVWNQMPFRLQNMVEKKTSDDLKNPNFNNLTKEDFTNILNNKPAFETLQAVYGMRQESCPGDMIIKRMDLPKAKVIF